MKKQELIYIEKFGKSFTDIQKNLLWALMIKAEKSSNSNSFFKMTKEDKAFIELKLRPSSFSEASLKLQEAGIIQITKDKSRKYKINNYKLMD